MGKKLKVESVLQTTEVFMALQIIGAIVFVAGAVIWCGNVFHFMPTVPLLGWGVMFVGGAIWKKGKA